VCAFERWPSCGSRCTLPEAPGYPCSLLPHHFFPDSPASTLAPCHCGVARDDSYRTVSQTARFVSTLYDWLLTRTPTPHLFHLPTFLGNKHSHTPPHPVRSPPNQGSNCRPDPNQAQLVKGTAHACASARERHVERRSGDRKGKATGVRWSTD
jgi:hypothetical protein